MKRNRTTLYVKGLSAKGGGGRASINVTVVDNPSAKPPRPPWHRRFVDQNLSLAKWLQLKEIARECGKQAVWEIGKWWLGRKRQPTKPAET